MVRSFVRWLVRSFVSYTIFHPFHAPPFRYFDLLTGVQFKINNLLICTNQLILLHEYGYAKHKVSVSCPRLFNGCISLFVACMFCGWLFRRMSIIVGISQNIRPYFVYIICMKIKIHWNFKNTCSKYSSSLAFSIVFFSIDTCIYMSVVQQYPSP